jgi:hypothetical protein
MTAGAGRGPRESPLLHTQAMTNAIVGSPLTGTVGPEAALVEVRKEEGTANEDDEDEDDERLGVASGKCDKNADPGVEAFARRILFLRGVAVSFPASSARA